MAVFWNHITTFRQTEGESLFDVGERYKDMIILCPHHGLEQWLIIHNFYNGLLYNTKMTINVIVGGALMNKPYEEAYQLIENMAQNHYQWGAERVKVEKTQQKGGMFEVNGFDHVNAKVEALIQKINNLTITTSSIVTVVTPNCDICGVQLHMAIDCQILTRTTLDHVNYAQGNPYSNTYNPG